MWRDHIIVDRHNIMGVLPSGIYEVVVTLAHWNTVWDSEGTVVISVRFLWILQVGVSFKRNRLLVCGATYLIFSCVWLCGKVRFLQPSGLLVKNCKSMLLGVFPQPILFQRLFDWSRCLRRVIIVVFKLFVGERFCKHLSFFYLISACFNVWHGLFGKKNTSNNRRTIGRRRQALLFSLYFCSSCMYFILTLFFLLINITY